MPPDRSGLGCEKAEDQTAREIVEGLEEFRGAKVVVLHPLLMWCTILVGRLRGGKKKKRGWSGGFVVWALTRDARVNQCRHHVSLVS